MKVTVEMSLYPLTDNYTEVIISFIKAMRSYKEISIHTTAMSTYITGEYAKVMKILISELEIVYTQIPDSSTVIKIIPKDLNVEAGFLEF